MAVAVSVAQYGGHYVPADTPEVSYAKQQFFAAYQAAASKAAPAGYGYGAPAPVAAASYAGGYGYGGSLDDGQSYPIAEPYIHQDPGYVHDASGEVYPAAEPYIHEDPGYVESYSAPAASYGAAPAAYAAPAVSYGKDICHNNYGSQVPCRDDKGY